MSATRIATTGRKKATGHRSSAMGGAAKPSATRGHEFQNTSRTEGAKDSRGWRQTVLGKILPLKYGKARSPQFGYLRPDTSTFGSNGVFGTYDRALTTKPTLIVGRKGAAGAVHFSEEPCWPIDTAFYTEGTDETFLPFFRYLLESLQLVALDRSTAIPSLSRDDYNSKTICYPESLDKQHHIVAEIEKQFTRLDAGVAALRRVQANLKRYRAAVLKAACEGRLVPSDMRAWKQLKVSEIGEAITGNTPPTSDTENLGDELPFFKPTDLDAGYNVREARQYLSAKGAKLARVLPNGAVLVTCIGATIGKTGFARVDCATNQQINALVVNPKIAIPSWAFWLFSSPLGQQQIKSKASATTLAILNKSKFEALEFPIPPLAEQTRIVAEVERRLSVVEELEAAVAGNLKRAQALRQSILKQAFEGKLA